MNAHSRSHVIAEIKDRIRAVPDFPKPGVMFRDIAPLLQSFTGLDAVVSVIANEWSGKIDAVVALDARGFIFGPLVAQRLKLPFVMVRKSGKLPGEVVTVEYDLEYGTAKIDMQRDALEHNARTLIVDDVLATGGTAAAAALLVRKVGATVAGYAFVIELPALNGRAQLCSAPCQSLVVFP